MDLSFDLKNNRGDHIRIDLSQYDKHNVEIFSKDPLIHSLVFYNLSLERIEKRSYYINPRLLFNVCDCLLNFLKENPNAIITYICDPSTDVQRNHLEFTPQEYRSNLFSKLFEYYTYSNCISDYIDELIFIQDSLNRFKNTYVHFIYNKIHKKQIDKISNIILDK